ncbi:hypothetical protein [Aequorivita viscosa]|uniref:Cell wall anchor protein n=1 Tax=Aequorivita viscosa TaxID=797419 RepID=A0A1M6KQT4_9FLAO|nr:hypothetical protein [Aequorivita viscosa]SDX03252.1 hypothetical protein SAMN05216556_11515 [Aequorivita viscosa]SHJ61266.1 hypothetical protein SAMN04487908_12110 [Aequorivita viscosa]
MKFFHLYISFFIKKKALYVLLFIITLPAFSQVGIGTSNPSSSSALEVASQSLGVLFPRMTTLNRTNISQPANSLLVYDTDERAFFYYDSIPPSPKWIKISSDFDERSKRVLVKSEADFPAQSGGKITLNPDFVYEINGTVNLTNSIDLNNATVVGRDGFEDIIQYSGGTGGIIFQGNTGGTVRNITLKGGGAFNITGPGRNTNTSLIVQNTVIDGMTTSVGTISGLGLYFGNIIQYKGNANGMTYLNIGNLLLINQGWFSDNQGAFETFSGTFGLIGKVSGFSTVSGSSVAMDFSSNPTVSNGVIQSVTFSGTTTAPSGYVKGYTTGTYTGYNFNNFWTVDAPGIPRESDAVATGDINFPGTVTGADGYTTSFNGGSMEKVWGDTNSKNLYRFTRDGNNRITYRGSKKRIFRVNASLSYQLTNTSTTVVLFFVKGKGSGPVTLLEDTKVYARVGSTNDIEATKIVGTIALEKDEYIEIWAERTAGNGKMFTVSLNLTAR